MRLHEWCEMCGCEAEQDPRRHGFLSPHSPAALKVSVGGVRTDFLMFVREVVLLQVCVSINASFLSFTLSISHDRGVGGFGRGVESWGSPPKLRGLSSDTAFLRVRCLPSALLPLAGTIDGRGGSQSDWALWRVSTPTTLCLWCLSGKRALWPGSVPFFSRVEEGVGGWGGAVNTRKTEVTGSQFKMDGGRSKMGDSESAFFFFFFAFLYPWQPAWLLLTCSHSLLCTFVPLPHVSKGGAGCAASTEVHCGSSEKRGRWKLHAQPSLWGSFRNFVFFLPKK